MMTRCSSKSACNNTGPARFIRRRLSIAVLLALAGNAQALPQGGEVVAGDASIAVSGETMDIQQNSQRAILNFQSFDINSQQTVNFHQPGADAVALSRVLGSNLSEIHGALNANGQVYLINPNGVLFGNGAQVNVGGLVVTTLDLADQDFLAGRDAFNGSGNGRVENQGSIDAQDRVVLLAPEVVNSGQIQVPDGEIVLRSSRQALLHTAGSDIPILVDDPDLVGRVTNQGALQAGQVALVLDGSGRHEVYDAAINNSGLVRAVQGSGEGGEIHLLAGTGVINSGTLDASAAQGRGGNVTVAAESINQSGSIDATATGVGDGGDIELSAADAIAMHSGSTIDASADQEGDAGDVVIIAEKSTWLTSDASIHARGGELGGDGGFVEVSGHEFVSVYGNVDVGAAAGDGGLLYIDPTDITITSGSDFNSDFSGSNPTNWIPNSASNIARINVTTLNNTLVNNGNVRISTASGASGAGNITFDAVLNYNNLGTTRSLTLVADNQIIFTANGGIWDSNPGTVDGITFTATAAAGFSIVDGGASQGSGVINTGAGRLDITVTTGDALITGLASSSAASDAIRVRALAGAIRDNGNKLWDFKALNAGGGAVISARDGIENLSLDVAFVDAVSSLGDISLYHGDVNNSPAYVLAVTRLSSANLALVHSERELLLTNADLGANDFQFSSSTFVALPQSGLTATGTLTLLGPDIVTDIGGGSYSRTLSLGADHLVINTNAAGGNLQINSNVNQLSVTNGFSNTITVTDANALTLGTVAPQNGNISISSGAGTDLAIGTDLNLTSIAGALTLGAGRNLLLNASIFDADGSGITLNAPNSVIFAAASQINAGTGNIGITATTGNVALGRLTGGNMTVTAGGAITDANGATLNLSGTSATLSAGTAIGTLADGLEGALGSLNITSAGGGTFLANDRALTLASLNINGNLNINLPTAGNLTLSQTNPTITGTATFAVGAGRLVVPNGGWSIGGNLTVNAAQGIWDSDSTVTLAAANADLTLGGAAANLNVDFNNLALQVLSGQQVQVTDTDDLTITNISSTGDLLFATGGTSNLTLTDATPAVGADLSVITGGDFILPTGGLNVAGDLTVAAQNLRDSDSTITLSAANADITLSGGATAQTWNTSFGTLALAIAGAGALSLTDANGLTLTSATTGGSASYRATNGNLVLTSVPTAGTDLTLGTVGSGNVIIPGTGLTRTGNLTVLADNLTDADHNVTLGAANANITLRDGAAARTWTTSFTNLVLAITGGGAFNLTDSNGLTLTSASTGGNASFTTTNADLVVGAAPVVNGNLSLITTGTGNVVIPATGLTHGGSLSINANNLSDGDTSLTLGPTTANINLRDGAAAQTWTTSFGSLVLAIAGTGAFSLTDTNGLTLTSAATGGSASYRATGANLVLTAAPTAGTDLTLGTVGSGNVVIPTAGLARTGNLTVLADNLMDTDHNVTLGAANANITLRDGAAARTWTTSFTNLVLAITGGGAFNLTDSNGLTLTSASTGGNASFTTTNADLVLASLPAVAGNLSLITTGTGNVVIPATGLTHGGSLSINANNLSDGDTSLTLGATSANINLRDGAAAQTWATSFNSLVLEIAGTGAFSLTDTNGLTLTSATTGGNASFTTTDADLVLTSSPVVAGNLSLTTTGTGNLVIPATGLNHGGSLAINANNLSDGDTSLTLGATSANINLRDGAAAQTWATSFDSLVLAIAGVGAVSLTDSNGLTLTSVSTGGNAGFTTTNADLVLGAAPVVTGTLALNTVGSGDVVIPDAGLVIPGNLTVSADDLRDSDTNLTLGAASANITLRDGDAARAWMTSFTSLVLDIAGNGAFSLMDSNGLTLTSASTGGNASFTTTNADLVLTSSPVVAGNLSLTTTGTGNLVIPATGLNHGDSLVIDANNLSDGDTSLILGATSADITLRDGAAAQTWATDFNSLALAIAGGGAFSLTDNDGLTLTSASTGGSASFSATNGDLVLMSVPVATGDLLLSTIGSGDLIIPAAGLIHHGNLTVTADDLSDGDSTLTLGATNASFNLRGGAAAQTWNTSFDTLALAIAGNGAFTLTDATDLSLGAITTGGDASFSATDADLVITASPSVGGVLSLNTTGAGNLLIPATGLNHGGGLAINVNDLSDGDTSLTLGATSANIQLRGGAAAQTWNTSFDALALAIAGAGDLAVTDTNGLTLTSASTGGNASYRATNGDLVLTAIPVAPGDLTLGTVGSGDVIIPDAGLMHTGNLTVLADNLMDSDQNVTLGATNADITLRDGAAARAWDTRFDALVLTISGGGDFSLTDSDGLLLSAIDTGGNASFSATDADLVLQSSPTVAGILSLATTGGGDLAIPDSGLNHGGALVLAANQIVDSDNGINLAGTSLTATLRDQQADANWTTSINSLDLNLAGGGNLTLANAGDLTIASLVSDGGASLSSTGDMAVSGMDVAENLALTSSGDLSLTNVTAGANLQLTTAPTGLLTTDASGLLVTGNLNVDAGRISDSEGSTAARWSANQIEVRLRDTTEATSLDLDAANIRLINDSIEAVNLQLADGTLVNGLSSGGDVRMGSTGGLALGASDFAVAGQLAFDLAGNLTLDAAGLAFDGGLQVTAANLVRSGGGTVTLAGSSADLILTGSEALDLNTRLSQLGVTYAAVGPFTLSNDRALTLTRFDAPAVTQLGLSVNGVLAVPASGLTAQQRLNLDAVDLVDDDRTVSLAAPQVMARLSNAAADSTWNLAADELDVLMRGAASLAVTDAGGLTLADLNNDGQAVSVENGNFVLDVTSGDLLLAANINAADLVDDGVRTGLIDLAVAAGNLSTQGAVNLVSTNNLDQDAAGAAGNYGIRLRLLDSSAANRSITLNEGAGLRAIGGDILIDTRPASARGGRREFVQGADSLIDVYNNPGDPADGVVLLNGRAVAAAAGQTVRSSRTLAIVTDVGPPDLGNPLDQIDDLDDATKVVDEVEANGPRASVQFEQVFGTCDELDQKNRHRCRVDAALKAFLSHWLVGGEMPPKTENP